MINTKKITLAEIQQRLGISDQEMLAHKMTWYKNNKGVCSLKVQILGCYTLTELSKAGLYPYN